MKRQDFFWPVDFKPVFIFTGKSASTKDLVKKVMAYNSKKPEEYKEFMEKYNKVNIDCKIAFEENDPDKISHFLEKSWRYRKLLGKNSGAKIEPDNITDMMFKFKLKGALTAGLLGAGGGDTILAICKDQDHKEHFTQYLVEKGFLFFDEVKITNNGYDFPKPKLDIHKL